MSQFASLQRLTTFMWRHHGALIAVPLLSMCIIDPVVQAAEPQQGIAYFCRHTKYRWIIATVRLHSGSHKWQCELNLTRITENKNKNKTTEKKRKRLFFLKKKGGGQIPWRTPLQTACTHILSHTHTVKMAERDCRFRADCVAWRCLIPTECRGGVQATGAATHVWGRKKEGHQKIAE